jgi:guanylate kinase
MAPDGRRSKRCVARPRCNPEIDWRGAQQVRKAARLQIHSTLRAPSSNPAFVIADRQRHVIEGALRDAVADMSHYAEFDYVIVSD